MDIFTDFLNRLKKQVGVSKDKEIAELLGMSVTAFAERKKRGSIPIKEVFDLARQRPGLEIDPDWVVSGVSKKMETGSIAERHLVECYRLMSDSDKKAMNKIATALSGVNQMSGEEIRLKLAAQDQRPYREVD
jgi:transcriptional regulator with XRE-family HTH domain